MPSDALNPSGPAQPSLNQAYTTPGNPAQKEPAEQREASKEASTGSRETTDQRIPEKQSKNIEDATPSSLGYGVHGAPSGEESKGLSHDDVGRHNELDGEQMRAPGEGEVADVVDQKPGATGGEESYTSDLDRKKAEQAPMREAIQEQRKEKVDVAGVLGQRGGPANPVDKKNYPNTGA